MEVWREWVTTREERGWPRRSIEVAAQQMAKTATVTDGQAAYTGTVELEGGRRVKKEAPSFPKETRIHARTLIPDIDTARLGPEVNRHLMDLDEDCPEVATVLMAHYLADNVSAGTLAPALGISVRTFWTRLENGLMWMDGRLGLKKRA